MLRSKIHRATLTGTEVDYEGSIAIDRLLIDAAQLLPGEQVHVLNVNNGARLVTYIIEAPAGSVVILSYCGMTDEEARAWRPIVVFVDEKNRQR
jgi:aspartate 1-decarboxylase